MLCEEDLTLSANRQPLKILVLSLLCPNSTLLYFPGVVLTSCASRTKCQRLPNKKKKELGKLAQVHPSVRTNENKAVHDEF